MDVTAAELHEKYLLQQEVDASVPCSDPRHSRMFEINNRSGVIVIHWGGYPYEIGLDEIKRPEDLLWKLHHLLPKRWKYMTTSRVRDLIEAVSRHRHWKLYHKVPNENECPKPSKESIKEERSKITPQIRFAVLRRDGWRCRACGFSVENGAHLHIDHIHPVSRGGRSVMTNLQTLCTTCNFGKGAD